MWRKNNGLEKFSLFYEDLGQILVTDSQKRHIDCSVIEGQYAVFTNIQNEQKMGMDLYAGTFTRYDARNLIRR